MTDKGDTGAESKALTGAEVRERLFAGKSPAAALTASPLVKPLSEWSEHASWDVWARPGLELKIRSLIVCTTLASLNRTDMLDIHLKAALRLGWSPEELSEAFLQFAVYAGVAAGSATMAVLVKAVAEVEAERAADD